MQTGKEKIKQPVYMENMIVCVENPKESTKKPPRTSKLV